MTEQKLKKNRAARRFLILLPVLLLCLYFLAPGIKMFVKALDSKNWPSVTGLIKSSGVLEQRHTGTKATDRSSYWTTNILFSYQVDGNFYTGNRIHLNPIEDRIYSVDGIPLLKNSYPAGKEVRVYYNPGDPTDSVLMNSITYYSGINELLLFIVAIIVVIILCKF